MKLKRANEADGWMLLLGGIALGGILGLLALLLDRRYGRGQRSAGGPGSGGRILKMIPRRDRDRRAGEPGPVEPPSPSSPASEKTDESRGGLERKWGGGTRDVVEQASWESFPASDPPAW